ncbi:MAG: response regulator [Candidatus Binataceae bacterium]
MAVRTLIVEDSIAARTVLQKRFEEIGCRIVGLANNSAEGLEMFRRLKPQLVSLDLLMPDSDDLNSKDLFRIIRKEAPAVAVVIVSAQSKAAERSTYIREGAIEYFEKPFIKFQNLAEKLARLFPDIRPLSPSGIRKRTQ